MNIILLDPCVNIFSKYQKHTTCKARIPITTSDTQPYRHTTASINNDANCTVEILYVQGLI